MAENIEVNSLKKRPKYWLLALLLFPLLCLFCYLEVATLTDRYYKKLDRQSPRPIEIQISESRIITSALPNCTYDLLWIDEYTLWLWDCKNDQAATISIRTGQIVYEKSTPVPEDELNIAIFEPTGKNKTIATCTQQNLVVRGGSTKQGEYEITLWREEKIAATFPFSSEQWENVDSSPDALSGFSPNCEYFYLVLYGDFGPESFATKELWLLDVPNESFKLAFRGRQEASYALFDVPVQYVIPSWSPDDHEFVFGDSVFGLEIYNVVNDKRRFLAGPSSKLSSPQWSPTGKWIAAQKYGEPSRNDSLGDDFLAVISPDGKEMALSSACSLIYEFAWSPSGKQIAYTCNYFSESSSEELASPCPEGEQLDCSCYGSDSSHETDAIWIWEIEK